MQTINNRVRDKTFAFHVTEEERREIETRILISGMVKTDYFIKTFLEQDISIKVGNFHSDRLSIEIRRLNEMLNSVKKKDDLEEVLYECKSFLNQLLPFFLKDKTKEPTIRKEDFKTENNDMFTDIEIY